MRSAKTSAERCISTNADNYTKHNEFIRTNLLTGELRDTLFPHFIDLFAGICAVE